MLLSDMHGDVEITAEEALLHRLRTSRTGPYGAFILSHTPDGPSLWIHTHHDIAYVHYFPDNSGDRAGFQPTGMTPPNCDDYVRFLMTDGSELSTMPSETLVSLDTACAAAVEFLHNPSRPTSINWIDL
jgi:hypothetical protein